MMLINQYLNPLSKIITKFLGSLDYQKMILTYQSRNRFLCVWNKLELIFGGVVQINIEGVCSHL